MPVCEEEFETGLCSTSETFPVLPSVFVQEQASHLAPRSGLTALRVSKRLLASGSCAPSGLPAKPHPRMPVVRKKRAQASSWGRAPLAGGATPGAAVQGPIATTAEGMRAPPILGVPEFPQPPWGGEDGGGVDRVPRFLILHEHEGAFSM